LPEISIILPTCDRPLLLGRALASLLAQTFPDFEVLLIDNNRTTSRVGENRAVATLLPDARIRILDGQTASSAATARNLGLRAARGNWITFLDDDDEYRPGKLAAQHQLAGATKSPLVLCGYEFVWPNRRRLRQVGRACFRGDEILTQANLGSPLLFHRRHDAIRFDEKLRAGEDVPYALQLIDAFDLREIPCQPEPLVVVHPQPAAHSVHANKEEVWRACRQSWRMSRARFSRAARRALLAQGRLERAVGGYGSRGEFYWRICAVLRTHGWHKWRWALFAVRERLKHEWR
jgi:glycosyltransferase involved in cell wall biosynthesis